MVRELYIQEQQEEGFTACCLTRTVGLKLSEGGFRARDMSVNYGLCHRMSTFRSLIKKWLDKLIYKNPVTEGH